MTYEILFKSTELTCHNLWRAKFASCFIVFFNPFKLEPACQSLRKGQCRFFFRFFYVLFVEEKVQSEMLMGRLNAVYLSK